MKKISLISSLILLIVLTGCTFNVPIRPKLPQEQVYPKVQKEVGIYVDELTLKMAHSQGGMFWLGLAHTWRFKTGAELYNSIPQVFQLVFEDVSPTDEAEDTKYDLIVFPKIQEFTASTGSMKCTVTLYYTIKDSSGDVIYRDSVSATSPFGLNQCCGMTFGVFAGKSTLSKSASKAFELAYEMLFNNLKKAVERGTFDDKLSRGKTIRIIILA